MRMSGIFRSTSEWHRRMTSNKLSQIGKSINYEDLIPGAQVYFYKPPSAQEVLERGRKAKHLDHYTGPATILRAIGTRSFVLQYTDGKGVTRTYQRDASMISPVPPKSIKGDPSISVISDIPPHLHRSLTLSPIEEGEYVIIKHTKESKTWYCAQVLEKLPDRIKVSYYTTAKVPYSKRLLRIQEAIFLKTQDLGLTHRRSYHFGAPCLTQEESALDWISPT
jgi:hypothetical protein